MLNLNNFVVINDYQVIFVGEWKEFIFNAFINLEPVQRSEDGRDKRRFRSFNHSTCKTVLNLLEAVYLGLRKIEVERVTVVKFRVDNRGSNVTCCFRIKVRTDTAELTNMKIAGLREWWDLIRESKIFIKDKTKVACARLSRILSFRVHVKLFYRIVFV